jgi:osmotically-inducible protein OsmY
MNHRRRISAKERTNYMKTNLDLKRNVEPEDATDVIGNHEDIGVYRRFEADSFAVAAEGGDDRESQESDELRIELSYSRHHANAEIACAAQESIRWITTIPDDAVQATVYNGWLILDGSVSRWTQKQAAEEAVRNVAGIKGVVNLIVVEPKVTSTEVIDRIAKAFQRQAFLDAQQVQVQMDGSEVVLRGFVHNHAQRREAERAAWATPRITKVLNNLRII